MRKYFARDGYYTPKNCIYGPRPNEGVILTPYEWWRINDHLFKWERDGMIAQYHNEEEEAKKETSLKMTKTWENTQAVRTVSTSVTPLLPNSQQFHNFRK